MAFLWPAFLYLLVIIPLLILVYAWMLRRRRRYAVRYSSLSLVRQALPRQSWLRRHLPFALFVLALVGLLLALARPVVITTLPADQTTVMLVMDVSMSMRFTDIQPSRLGAAEQAAMSFIQRQKSTMQIGLVAFSSYAELIQPPTTDQDSLLSAIESLTTGRRTAIGSGILKAIDAIAEVDKNVAPSVTDTSAGAGPVPVAPGAYAPEIIVLLTDGVSNTGPRPLEAAKQAADRGLLWHPNRANRARPVWRRVRFRRAGRPER
jgi:Ca-activated chloride channel homolog